ncbi:2450fac3-37e9-46ac-9973-3e4dd025ec67 [Sclerotinia trifoliorum]|uniref:2450fac3-37e9-46ac-9973-3e4dd025ec67 n=1 Tax=Sclerotinia trifoliorum TaxID=28548 RepID=A0A8H2VY70_9HELO|nr:2450fac3-37e9-46ac-9973-3e4dd025ec67 [Sclerotinia trifoliorum]
MPRRRRFLSRPSPLHYMEAAYELPPRPRSPDIGETNPVQASDENLDHDQQPRGSSADHLENDPASSSSIDIRRDSMFVGVIPDSEKSPEATPTTGSPLIVSSDMGREPVESNNQILRNPSFAPIIEVLQEVSADSDDLEDSGHIEYAPSSQGLAHETSPNDGRIPSASIIRKRGLHDRGFTRICLGLKTEEIKRPLDLKEAIRSLQLSKEPLNLRSRRHGSEEEKEIKKPIPKYVLHHDSLDQYWEFTGQKYKRWIPSICRLWIPEYRDGGGQRHDQPPCPANLFENDLRAAEYFQELDKFNGWVSLDIDPLPDIDLRLIRTLPRSTPARPMGTMSHKNLDFRKPSRKCAFKRTSKRASKPARKLLLKYRVTKRCDFKRRRTRKFEAEISRMRYFKFKPKYIRRRSRSYLDNKDLNVDTNDKSLFRWRNPSYSDVHVDFLAPLVPPTYLDNDYLIDPQNIFLYWAIPPSFHLPENDASGDDASGNNVHILARNFPSHPSKDHVPNDDGYSTRGFNLPKMPGAYPSSSPESLSDDEELEALVEVETDLHGVSQVVPCKDLHMDCDNDAQSDGSRSPRRRPQYISENGETTPHPAFRKYEFIVNLAQGVTNSNKPDPFRRLFSVARIQNDTTEDRKARKRRRSEIIRDDSSSDEDWDAQGEPRKILRLHLSEVTKHGKPWEPLTDEKARELMARGRAENYVSVWQRSGHPNGSAGIQPEKEVTSAPVRPRITRGQPMNIDEGVDMGAIETKMKTLPQNLSVRDLRELHYRANVICNWNASNKWAQGSNIAPKAQKMKREMQEIRDKAVSTEPLATVDDRHRAAILIKYIIDTGVSVNGAGENNPAEDWAWFHDIEYDYDAAYTAVETELEQLAAEIKNIPEGCTIRKKKEEQYKQLEDQKEAIEIRGEFYDDEGMDNKVWENPCYDGKLVPGDSRLNAEYGSAIAKWQNPTTDEDSELKYALELSKAMFEENNIQNSVAASLNKANFVESMNQGPSHSVVLPPINKWQDSLLDEKAQLEKAIAMSLAESRGEDMEQYDDDY